MNVMNAATLRLLARDAEELGLYSVKIKTERVKEIAEQLDTLITEIERLKEVISSCEWCSTKKEK